MENKLGPIGVDLDDTIADSTTLVIKLIRMRYDPKARIENWKDFNVEKYFNMTYEQIRSIYAEVWSNPSNINLVNDCIPEIISWLSRNHEIYLITATSASAESYKLWLKMHNINLNGIFNVINPKLKVAVGLSQKIEYYIDNDPNVSKDAAKHGKHALLFKCPWNAKAIRENRDELITPVSSWGDIKRFFESEDGIL